MKKSRKNSPKKDSKKPEPKTKSSKNKMPIILGVIVAGIIGALVVSITMSSEPSPESPSIQNSLQKAQEIIDGCTDDVHCAVEELQALSAEHDNNVILPLFVDLITLYDSQVPCHETGHHLGLWLYGYVGDLENSLNYAQQQCGGAVFHGVIQNHMMTLNFKGEDPANVDIQSVCKETPDNTYSIDRWQCLHGLGHGLTNLYNYDVLSAVNRCNEFEPGWEQISCSKGVFMQNVVNYVETRGGDFDENDIYYPCNQVETKLMPQCYHYLTTKFLLDNDGLVRAGFDICDDVTPSEIVPYCYYGLGRQLSANLEGSIDNAVLFCTMGSNLEYHSDCFRGMALTVVNQDEDPSLGFEFCNLIPEQYGAACFDSLGQWVLMIAPTESERTTMCLKAGDGEFRDICNNASLDSIAHL